MSAPEDLVDFDEADTAEQEAAKEAADKKDTKTSYAPKYVAMNSAGFRDFLLKPELLRAVMDCGFEHPSEVQHVCIPQATLGQDVLCQAQSGLGKTAVFVLSVLHQLETPKPGVVQCLVLCHTRELAFQICREFERFSKYLPDIKTAVFYGGIDIKVNKDMLKNEVPNIVVGTPGRVKQLVADGALDLSKTKHFVIDECDRVLEKSMLVDVKQIFVRMPKDKQVMMFSATLDKAMRPNAKAFMHNPLEIYVDDESKLTLHGLQQYYVRLTEREKNKKLNDLLDMLEFNQVVIFVKTVERASELNRLLRECNYPSICVHSSMSQDERIAAYKSFKDFEHRILVTTDLFGRGIDVERVNIVINYDMAFEADQYLHRVGRAGRFGTKGLAISFVSTDAGMTAGKGYQRTASDEEVLQQVQDRFSVKILPLPDHIDPSTYLHA